MDRYVHFELDDFAEDAHFISWVRGDLDDKGQKLWEDFLKNHPEKRAVIDQAKYLINALQFDTSHDVMVAKHRVWQKIEMQTRQAPKTNIRRLYRRISGVAAAVVFLIAAYFVWQPAYDTDVQTQYAEVQEIALPDGSIVHINVDSRIQYQEEEWNQKREVYLEGEAFFKVQRGSKFTVKTKNGNIAVLGTSFNVFSRNKVLDVVCRTGKVSVATDRQQVVLMPNESVKVDKHRMHNKTSDMISESRDLWIKGMYHYDNTYIEEVFADIERQFDVRIEYERKIKEMPFKGSYSGDNLEKVMYQVCWPLKLEYKIVGDKIKVSINE